MAVTPVYGFDIPAPVSDLFTNGEQALTPAPSLGGAANGTYYLSKRIELPPGIYFLKAWLEPTGSITINGVTITRAGLVQTQVDVPDGEIRIDITLTKSAPSNCYAAFLLFLPSKVIYASAADGWVFDTAPLSTGSVPAPVDRKLSLPVFTLRPNWADGVSESVMFSTDVMTSETAMEQRRALMEKPRRMFEASFLRTGVLRARLDSFLAGIGRREFLLPLWHEQYSTPHGVDADETYHQFPTDPGETLDLREFLPGDAVLIDAGDPGDYEVVLIDTVDVANGRVYWAVAPSRTWPQGTRLTPLRKARIIDSTSLDNRTDRVAVTRLRFVCSEPMTGISPNWGHCAPVWQFPINWAEGVNIDFERLTFEVDNGSGLPSYTDPGDRALVSSRFGLTLRGRKNVQAFRAFIAAARGRAVRFYAPSNVQGIVPSQDLGGLFFYAEPMGFTELMPVYQDARRMIGIVFKDGSPTIYRTVVSVSEDIDLTGKRVERFVLDAELPPIELALIERVQFIVPSRFDQDTFELNHPVDASRVVTTSTVLRSIDPEGMPPIMCDVTSTLYPVETSESLNVLLSLTGGMLRDTPKATDSMDVAIALSSAILREPLVTYNDSGDALDVTFSLSSGTLRQPLVSLTTSGDALDVAMEITNGTLAVKLLTEVMDPEGLNVALSMHEARLHGDEGTLTWDDLDVAWDDTEETWDNTPFGS